MTVNFKTLALIAAVLSIASLGACGGRAKPAATSRVEPSPPADAAESSEPQQAALPSADSPPAPVVARRKIVPLDKMSGLTARQITEILGVPQFLRQDNLVELWQYRADSCVLHLFLYRNNNEWQVRHAELQPRTVSGPALKDEAAEACLIKLMAAPPAPTS